MEIPWKLYLSCWFLGAAVQSAVFFTFNAADYFNYFFPDQYKPEVYLGVTVGVGASLGAVLTVFFQPKRSHLTVLVVTLTVSAILLVIEVVVTPLNANALSNPTRFGSVIAVVFVATVVQNVGGGALYGFVGKHFPKFGIHAAQSGGVCAFAATFIIRCISKGSFEHLRDRDQGFRLSGYLFVALVDLIILIACCLIAILRAQVNSNAYAQAGRLNTSYDNKEQQPLLRSDDYSDVSRKRVIRNNWAALATVCLTLVISNALFPGITSQFHGNYNCSSSHNVTTLSSDNPKTPFHRAAHQSLATRRAGLLSFSSAVTRLQTLLEKTCQYSESSTTRNRFLAIVWFSLLLLYRSCLFTSSHVIANCKLIGWLILQLVCSDWSMATDCALP